MIELDYDDAIAVTASDTVNDAHGPFAGFYVGVAGAVKVTTVRGRDVSFPAVPAGTVIRLAIARVWSTGTQDATKVVGLGKLPYAVK